MRSPIRSPNRRQRLQSALTGATGLGLFGCIAWTRPRVITLREAELVDRLARLFPLTDRVLEVLEVLDLQLGAPRLRLLPESNHPAKRRAPHRAWVSHGPRRCWRTW